MKLGHQAVVFGIFASLIVHGCAEPGGIVSVTPPGASLPKVSPDSDPSQALGEAAGSLNTTAPKATETKAAETKAADAKATPADTKAADTKPAPTVSAASTTSLKPGQYRTTPRGVKYEVIKEGSGAEVTVGQKVAVHYVGKLENGTEFDSSRPKNSPLRFVLGAPGLIEGWGEGIPGMKVGEIRKLTIPPDLGYGSRGFPGRIPANSTLIFEIELLSIGS